MRKKLFVLAMLLVGVFVEYFSPREASSHSFCPPQCFGPPEAICCYECWPYEFGCACSPYYICY